LQKQFFFKGLDCVALASYRYLWSLRHDVLGIAEQTQQLQSCVRHIMVTALGKDVLLNKRLGNNEEHPQDYNLSLKKPLQAVERMIIFSKI